MSLPTSVRLSTNNFTLLHHLVTVELRTEASGLVGISWSGSVGWNGKEGTRSLPTVGLQPFYKQLCVGGFDNYSTQTFLVQFWILVELVFNCLLTVRLRPSLHLIQPATFWWIWVKSFDNKLNMMFSNCSTTYQRQEEEQFKKCGLTKYVICIHENEAPQWR